MPVRFLMLCFLISPIIVYAEQNNNAEEDLELFEFLALFDEKDNDYIDTEMSDEKIFTKKSITTSNLNNE